MFFNIRGYNLNIMNGDEKQKQNSYIDALTSIGSPTRPIHVTPNTWDEKTKQLEDNIRDTVPFEGKWQSYIKEFRLFVPETLQSLFDTGGVMTVGPDNHLMIFGNRHWLRFQKLLSKEVGLSPVHNEVARHYYSNMIRFHKLNEDGSVDIPLSLVQYAGLEKEVAIIGMIYHAEIHNKASYLKSEQPSEKQGLLDRFKKIKFN